MNLALKWQADNPEHEIHILSWENNKEVELFFDDKVKFHFVNREKIASVKSSQVIPNFHAVNELWENIKEITQTHWDNVFNYSNDEISGTLSSILKFDNFYGVRYSESKNILFTNDWAEYINEVYPLNNISINRYELLKNLTNTNITNKIEPKNPYAFLEAQNALTDLKKSQGSDLKIVAFDSATFTSTDWNLDKIAFKLSTTNRYLPVFIHTSGNIHEVPMLEKVQKALGDEIIIIETDIAALDSVVNAIDILICQDGLSKQMAHTWGTPSLHVRIKNLPQENTGYSYHSNDLVLETEDRNLVFEELLSCVDILTFGKPQISGQWLFNDIYQVKEDMLGNFKIHINPSDDSLINIASYMSRIFFYNQMNDAQISIRETHIFNLFTAFEIKNYLQNEQDVLKKSSKNLLQAIRNLQEMKGRPEKIASFIKLLDSFFKTDSPHFITFGVNLMLRTQLESLPEENSMELFNALESMLFELKARYKTITGFLESVASPARIVRGPENATNE